MDSRLFNVDPQIYSSKKIPRARDYKFTRAPERQDMRGSTLTANINSGLTEVHDMTR